jgi:hypothetical protein
MYGMGGYGGYSGMGGYGSSGSLYGSGGYGAAMVGMEVVWEVMVALAYDLVKLN